MSKSGENPRSCGLRKDQWVSVCRKSIASRMMVAWCEMVWDYDLKRWCTWQKREQQINNKMVIIEPVSLSLKAYFVPGDVLSTSGHHFTSFI